jgi:thioredoxin reductase (NADPH)
MSKPYILAVDDDPQVANAVVRDLRAKYAQDYQVLKAGSGDEALAAVAQLKQRNASLALMLVDQRMPSMSGTEFLTQAMHLYPQSRKVLLTAYADTEAAIDSINAIGLDHYLMKPWDPPEQNLYPVLDDLLGDWIATVPVPFDGIRVAGTLWSAKSHQVKDFLARNRIPYQWLDIEVDGEARTLVESLETEQRLLPAVFFPDGSHLIAPDILAVAEKVGLKTEASEPFYDLIIIGGGPAGLGAAVYGASEGLRTLMLERHSTGGQAGTSSRIENYLGFPKGLKPLGWAPKSSLQNTQRQLGSMAPIAR